ncbi:glycosyltransferase family 2 protein [Chitinophagaceae bacterium MMS25-I14]
MDVSVVIINYNTLDLTEQCIRSVIKYTSGITYEIILVDNASTKEQPDRLAAVFPELKLVKSEKNLGFSGGNNLGILYASGKYILLLNSDTYLTENSLFTTFRYMEEHPQTGVLSARLIFPDGRHQAAAQRFPSVKYQLAELLRLQKLMSKKAAGRFLLGAFFDHNETVRADWVWGTYFMFRKELLNRLPDNKLDDTYFMYNEDVQWCMDIRKLGYEIHFFAGTSVVHLMGGSSGMKNDLMVQNGELFLKKNYSPLQIRLMKLLSGILHR